ncbi:MAG TPA: tetratricopeptide repeat protein [Acidobacteriaceae bacterium]
MKAIPFFRAATPLTPAERLAKRHLVIQDTLALLSVLAVTCILAVLTWLIFRSYSQHQSDAAARWKRRGEDALAQGKPAAAVYDLRTSLGYGQEDTGTQLELAEALAEVNIPRSLGEAAVYLNTLWEKEPGNGNINLQLARVLARQGQAQSALDHYHAAVYGVWEGQGAVRGRQARLEMVRYQIALGRYNDARGELLIAAGNDNSTPTLMEVAGLLIDAHAPADALHLYQEVARRRPVVPRALEGAGQMAFTLGRYRTAREYLEKALNVANAAHSLADKALAEKNLRTASAVVALNPSPALPQWERLRRVVRAYETARKRYTACANGNAGETPAQNGATQIQNNQEMTALGNRWNAAPPRLTTAALANDANLEAATMQLVYDTEQVTAHVCGEPGGDDAALLRIATSPESVNQ